MGNFGRINRMEKIHWQRLAAGEQEHFKSAWVKSDINVSLNMAVPAVWRLINLLAFIEPKQHAEAHRRDACAPLPKSKSKLLLV
jgi:hypothetical protein